MNVQQALQIKRSLETFFYKVRFNIGLHNVIKSPQYINFRKELELAINNQILYYAKYEKVNEIIGMEKAVRNLDDAILLNNLNKIWLPLVDIMERDEIKTYFLWASDRGGQIAVNKLKASDTFHLTNEKLLKRVGGSVGDFFEQIDLTTKSWIARTVEQGLLDDSSILDIAKILRNESISVSSNRADTIAEQETVMLLGEMALEVYIRSGIDAHKWVTNRDERVCLICASNEDAGEVHIGESFPNGSISTPAHIRCRCYTLPVISDSTIDIWLGD